MGQWRIVYSATLTKRIDVVGPISSHLSNRDLHAGALRKKRKKRRKCPPRASDDPEEEQLFRDLWEDQTQREVVIESLKADCEVRRGRPPGL